MSIPILLEDRSVIAVSGPEARGFLQGLITNDIEKVSSARAIYAALLTPQGKILFDFIVTEGDGALLIDCRMDARDSLVKRLGVYRLRAKIEIEARDQLRVFADLHGAAAARGITFVDPRLPALGHRTIGASAEMPPAGARSSAYRELRLSLGVPEGPDFGSDRMFALDAGLEELNAISFEKGCYVGQELTARMKHRGVARKRLLPIRTTGCAQLPAAGAPVTAGGQTLGEIASTYGEMGFALVRLDRLEEGRAPIFADTTPVTIDRPHWLFS
jgi:folate-binding protein YgfZ